MRSLSSQITGVRAKDRARADVRLPDGQERGRGQATSESVPSCIKCPVIRLAIAQVTDDLCSLFWSADEVPSWAKQVSQTAAEGICDLTRSVFLHASTQWLTVIPHLLPSLSVSGLTWLICLAHPIGAVGLAANSAGALSSGTRAWCLHPLIPSQPPTNLSRPIRG